MDTGQTSQLRDEGVDVVDERRGIQSLINISRSSRREAEILDFENLQFLPPLQRGSFRTTGITRNYLVNILIIFYLFHSNYLEESKTKKYVFEGFEQFWQIYFLHLSLNARNNLFLAMAYFGIRRSS